MNPIQYSKRRSYYALLAAAGAVIVALLLGGIVSTTGDDKDNASAESPTTTEQDLPGVTVPGDVEVVVNSDSLREGFEGPVAADEIVFAQEAEAAMATADQERGANAHSDETIETVEELVTALNSGDPKTVPIRARVSKAIHDYCGGGDASLHVNEGQGWILMVVKPASQVKNTSYHDDGGLRIVKDWREVGENDAYWLPVCTQGKNKGDVVWDGVVRADCLNGHDNPKIRIKRPDTPPAPPVECMDCPTPTTTVPPTTVPPCKVNCSPTTTLTPKDPSKDVNVNPAVPPQVRGPGTTPVGTDPGPATPTCDSPTGYCSGSQPTTTTTTRPPSSGGSSTTTPTTVPSCGTAGQPSCDNTGVTPPTTEAPPPAPPDTSSPDVTVPSP